MAQPLMDLVEQFCVYQRKQRGRTEGGVKTYQWNLEQFLDFVRQREGRLARAGDLTPVMIQAWMEEMASDDLATSTMRARQSTLSSFCTWLVKRSILSVNPVAHLDRPPHAREAPTQVPGPAIMDALVRVAKARRRPRDVAIFLIFRYTGMRRESVATLGFAIWIPSGDSATSASRAARHAKLPSPRRLSVPPRLRGPASSHADQSRHIRYAALLVLVGAAAPRQGSSAHHR